MWRVRRGDGRGEDKKTKDVTSGEARRVKRGSRERGVPDRGGDHEGTGSSLGRVSVHVPSSGPYLIGHYTKQNPFVFLFIVPLPPSVLQAI